MQQHYMQAQLWADVKKKFGWKYSNEDGLIIYNRSVPGVGRLFYAPGVMGVVDAAKFTKDIKQLCSKAFAIRLELNEPYDENLMRDFEQAGWKKSKSHVQYRHTINIDLTKPQNDMWMNFKSRGRYEVLQAEKAGVTVELTEPSNENLNIMYELMHLTSHRNKFFIRDKKFSMEYWRKFRDAGQLRLFFAKHEGEILAGSVILTNGRLAWNKDGGSTRAKANLMAPRLVQWAVIKHLKKEGFTNYDLGGIPPQDSFEGSRIPGIYIFKSAFSKESTALMPTLELPLSIRYKMWPKAEKQWLRAYNLLAHNLWW